MIAHATEDVSRVRAALDFFLSGAGVREDSKLIEEIQAEGHHGNPITILSVQLKKKAYCLGFAHFVRERFSKEDVKLIGKDIRFIKQNKSELKPKGFSFYGTFAFYSIYLLCLAAFVAVFILNRKKIKENANLTLVRNKRANKVALKRLKEASVFLKNNQAELFYEAVIKALWGYLSDKLTIPVADLNRQKASESLLNKGIDQEAVTELIQILDDCEFARYAPAAFSGTMKEVYDGAAKVMGIFEKQIK